MNLPGIPDSLPASRVWDWIAGLGIDINDVPWGEGITINGNSIEVTLFAKDADGHRYVDTHTQEAALHRVSIPLTDDIHAATRAFQPQPI